MYMCINLYTLIYIYIYIYVCICMYICTYVNIISLSYLHKSTSGGVLRSMGNGAGAAAMGNGEAAAMGKGEHMKSQATADCTSV